MAPLRHARPAALSQAKQIFAMARYQQFRVRCVRDREVRWTGTWRPTELSPEYCIEITYPQGRRPRIAILSPILPLGPGHTKLPHVFEGQKDICVHTSDEWNSGKLIADTILPWVSQWLYFYEVWALTGKWFGKGTHPDAPQHRES